MENFPFFFRYNPRRYIPIVFEDNNARKPARRYVGGHADSTLV